MSAAFDLDAIFDDDYVAFHAHYLTDDQAIRDTTEVIRRLGVAAGARILDVPCGTARLTARLGAAGYVMTGVDRSRAYLDLGAEELARLEATATLVEADMETMANLGTFDAVICWFNSFGYLVDPANEELLARFYDHLCPGGRLLIDTLHHDGVVTELAGESLEAITEIDGAVVIETMTFDSSRGAVVTRREVHRGDQRTEAHHVVRLPTIPEWRRWLAAAGFSEVSFTDRNGDEVTSSTFELIVSAVR